MKKIFYRIVCLLCIIIIIVMPMIYEFYWDSKTQVKHFELVTNRRIPIYRNSGFYVDFNENFYVGIDDFKWIEVFDKDGKFICSIGMQGIVYNFYVDKDKLLHVFCTYRTAENIYEQVIDIDTNSIILEQAVDDITSISMNPTNQIFINNKLYSIDKNIVKIKGENYEKEIKLDVEIRQENLLY